MSEEKTRIVPRSPAKPPAGSITFKCSNGHRIIVQAALAGKRGTCSKCGIAVVIPSLDGAEGTAPEPATRAELEPAPTIEPANAEAPASSIEPAAAEPAPPAEPVAAAEAEEPDAFADLFGAVSAEPSRDAALAEAVADTGLPPAEAGSSGSIGDVVPRYAADEYAGPSEASAGAENPTAQLVARLWAERDHGGIVELHVAGGSVILPEWFEPQWSRGTHGLFASQAADGTVTLTAVAWDSIQKIIVRQVKGLPDGMFE